MSALPDALEFRAIKMPAMAGARKAGALRSDDFYPTPPCAVHALCNVEQFDGAIWEPACGDGAISRFLIERGYSVVSTDLVDRNFGQSGIDFLMEHRALAPNIITNPPYKLALEFVEHALVLVPGKVAMLLQLAWLEGQERRRLFDRGGLARVWVFSRRIPMMHRGDFDGLKASSAIAFAWFVWDHTHTGAPTIGWL